MIEPTPRTIPTKARLQIVDAVGLVGPLRVRLATAPQSQLPQRLCIPPKSRSNSIHQTPHFTNHHRMPQKETKFPQKINRN